MKKLGEDGNVKALAVILLNITTCDTFVYEMDFQTCEKRKKQLRISLKKFMEKKDVDKKLLAETRKAEKVVQKIGTGVTHEMDDELSTEEEKSDSVKKSSRKKNPSSRDND